MTLNEELEKLESLYKRGILTEDELITQKGALLYPNIDTERKSRVGYVIFALFLGIFGAHNFYVGRWKRGLCQLLLTLLTCFIGAIFVKIWAIVNIFTIRTDGKGKPFFPAKKLDYILGTLAYFIISIVLLLGVLSGVVLAVSRYKMTNYITAVQQAAITHYSDIPIRCSEVVPAEDMSNYFTACILYPEGSIELINVNETVKEGLLQDRKIKQTIRSSIVIPAGYTFNRR